MSGDMMAKPGDSKQDIPVLSPEGLKELGLPADASFGDVMATALVKGFEKVESLTTPEEREAYFAEVAARQGTTPEKMRAEIEAAMNLSEDELIAKVMEGPIGRLIEQDLARSDAKKQETPGAQ